MAAELHKSRRVIGLAQILREEVTRAGFDLPPGDSAERMVADKALEMSQMLGVSTRTVLSSYMTDESMTDLAKNVAVQFRELTEVLDDAPPVAIGRRDAFIVQAAFGMCATVALRNLEHPNAMIVLKDSSDSVVHLGISMATSTEDPAKIGGMVVSIGRKVITMVIELLHDGTWQCTCGDQHSSTEPCALAQRLAIDLGVLGGWVPNWDEARPSTTSGQP